MQKVQRGLLLGLLAQVVLLALLSWATGLGVLGWATGLVCGAVTCVAVRVALSRHGRDRLGPADGVTLVRAVLASGVAALVLDGHPEVPVLVGMATLALVLDRVDGEVARRTGTVSRFGAAFDMEVDAFLILVLSLYVAAAVGPWVLLIGLARYALWLVARLLPWLREDVPPRPWAKLVAAVQGVVLTVVAAGVLPHGPTVVLLAGALALLAVSFGHQVWWLRSHRTTAAAPRLTGALTVLAVVLVWFGLTAPDQLTLMGPSAFVRLPVELLVVALLVLVLPARAARATALVLGAVLGVLTVVKVLDLGFYAALNRPFDSVIDWRYLGSAVGLVDDSLGRAAAVGAVVLSALAVVALLALMPWAVLRLTRVAARHRRWTLRTLVAAGTAWSLCLVLGLHVADGVPVASAATAEYAYGQVARIPSELRDQRAFARAAQADPLRRTPAGELLTGLRGKDVLFVFVESYGRVAVQDSTMASGVDRVLDDGTRRLDAAGFGSRSAFLTSPTFGAISWLAHSTLQSGLWVDSQQRYDVLMTSPRFTLSQAFGRAGWRTVSDVPANTHDWPQGAFYHYDRLYDSRNVGYRGPRFGYPTMPDQYTLDAFHRLELARTARKPVMAEIDLITSHAPWSRTPHLVDQAAVGDGSVFDGMPEQAPSKTVIWRSPERVRAAYGQSIEYSLSALVTFLEHYGDDKTVLVFLGDHQPAPVVSGEGADHDVPVTVVAKDPAVLRRIDGWHWQPGLHPSPDAPVWRMDAFRDRFLSAFGP